ncbi:hypothetical protein BDN72DRAFT_340415 [Pluteus cervinus]|uniref:Uncharacterized protein n=1 Tax=Pluteus cervinus TaxID=181527 RepID=A0ACD3AAX5_9AGAR|nr:hypothetical protein BDN72DRAFT_340415 [Pluteus cervinus]
MTPDIAETYGALLLGALFAAGLSGILLVQVVVYFKLYPDDPSGLKFWVLVSWLFDLLHTGFIWATLWGYFVKHFGVSDQIAFIPIEIPITVILTAISTFLVHCFFVHRIFLLSNRNQYITTPIFIMVFARLFFASVSSTEMIRLHTFNAFATRVGFTFTSGLALSSGADILITMSLFVLLRQSRSDTSRGLQEVIDSLILYTLEIGSLTAAVTIATMICWLYMNNNLIFLGLHFVIEKLYANSFLATLNSRHPLRQVPSGFTTSELPSSTNNQKRESGRLLLNQYRPRSGRNQLGSLDWEFFKTIDTEVGSSNQYMPPHSAPREASLRHVSTKVHRGTQHDWETITIGTDSN